MPQLCDCVEQKGEKAEGTVASDEAAALGKETAAVSVEAVAVGDELAAKNASDAESDGGMHKPEQSLSWGRNSRVVRKAEDETPAKQAKPKGSFSRMMQKVRQEKEKEKPVSTSLPAMLDFDLSDDDRPMLSKLDSDGASRKRKKSESAAQETTVEESPRFKKNQISLHVCSADTACCSTAFDFVEEIHFFFSNML